jgi:hypothetical protein
VNTRGREDAERLTAERDRAGTALIRLATMLSTSGLEASNLDVKIHVD